MSNVKTVDQSETLLADIDEKFSHKFKQPSWSIRAIFFYALLIKVPIEVSIDKRVPITL